MAQRSIATALAVLFCAAYAAAPARAEKNYGPGVSDTEIKLGQTQPYSGPLSALSAVGRAQGAYIKMIDDQGGINGRKVNLISLDDGYSPPKTVEQTRKLVEEDGVLAIFGSLGTPANTAIYKYLNERHVPQLFIASGASKWRDYKTSPWTISGTINYVIEGGIYGKYILRQHPDAKIAVLYQNDDFGKDYLNGLKERLGDRANMIVATASYETSDPTIDSQVISLKQSGADTLVEFSLTKFTSQAIRKVAELGWKPTHFVPSTSNGIGAVLTPAGIDNSIGLLSAQTNKTASDSQWANDPGYKDWLVFMHKYLPDADINDIYYVAGYNQGQLIVQALRQCGDELTRENLMRQATNLKNVQTTMSLPGITVTTSPTDYDVYHSARLSRFDGKSWVLFGDLISN
ncbi:MAG TPA: ABC transporter substrate-binding protein [Stellaceae bacterium]|nr:ABC transporter substrate-binding protein [Stellaceae bacterium]